MNNDSYIKYFTTDNKSGYKTRELHVKEKFPELYKKINEYPLNGDDFKFNQKLYNYLYDIIEIPKCLTCGKKIKWRGIFTEGYKEYCNLQCSGNGIKRINNIKKTVVEKYGVDSISKLESIKSKIKKNNKNKYGVDHIFQTEDFLKKAKNTNKLKYGNEHPIKTEIIKNKIIENNLKKYGVSNPSKLNSIKQKIRNTNIEKYGVESVMKVGEIKGKVLDNKLNLLIKKNNIQYKIENIENHNYLVSNECLKHKSYIINKTLFYHRIKYGVEKKCIHCNPISKNSSIKEGEIKSFIKNDLLLDIYENDKKILNNKELDIYIETKNFAIEFNGLYWHSNLFLDNNYHLNKTKECDSLGIKLLHIFEDEWVLKNNIVRSIIKNHLGLLDTKIYANECAILNVDLKTSKKFLDNNHIQGSTDSNIRIGLYYHNQLVSLMLFNKKINMINSKIEEYEMCRYSNILDTNVVGGEIKLFDYFLKTYKPKKITTYVDRRYFDGKLFENLGFKFVLSTKPNYWYFKKGSLIREDKNNHTIDNIINEEYDKSKTEFQIMEEKGYLRIYDCGNLKFEYNP